MSYVVWSGATGNQLQIGLRQVKQEFTAAITTYHAYIVPIEQRLVQFRLFLSLGRRLAIKGLAAAAATVVSTYYSVTSSKTMSAK